MKIGDKVSILQTVVVKRGKTKTKIVGVGVIIDYAGTVGFNDDESVYVVKVSDGEIKEFCEEDLKLTRGV